VLYTVLVIGLSTLISVAVAWHNYAKTLDRKPATAAPDTRSLACRRVDRITDVYSPPNDGELNETWREYWHGLTHPR
jgi:hypothetical protein